VKREVQGFFLTGQSGPNVNGNYRHYPAWIPIENGIANEMLAAIILKKIRQERTTFSVSRLPEDYPQEA
jgi:hypothetical protein